MITSINEIKQMIQWQMLSFVTEEGAIAHKYVQSIEHGDFNRDVLNSVLVLFHLLVYR